MSRANEPAYPHTAQVGVSVTGQVSLPIERAYGGLTIREVAAIAAMQGLCAHFGTCGQQDIAETARRAVMVADALLAELAKTPAQRGVVQP